jgi:hypothetical protein
VRSEMIPSRSGRSPWRWMAYQLISFLIEERPGDVRQAVKSAVARGQRWRKLVEMGLEEINRKYNLSVQEVSSTSFEGT